MENRSMFGELLGILSEFDGIDDLNQALWSV